MTSPHLPGDRFFARLRTFDMECPICGEVYVIRPSKTLRHHVSGEETRRTGGKRKRTVTRELHRENWDEVLQYFYCQTCSSGLALGVVAWPLRPGARMQPPEDTIPTPRQANAIRQGGGGFYQRTRKGADDPRNVYVTQACCCQPDSRTSHPSCPVHGPAGNPIAATPPRAKLGSLPHYRDPKTDYDKE